MNPTRSLTPEYWVFHDTKSSDIYVKTLAKNFEECLHLARQHQPKEYRRANAGEKRYDFTVIEIRQIARPF